MSVEQWEEVFKGFGEKTYTIDQKIQNAQEGDNLNEVIKEIKEAHDQIVKEAKELPNDIPSFDDEGAQIQLENAATDIVIAGNKLIASATEKADMFKEHKDLGKIINKVILTNNTVLDKPYPLANPYAPKITGQSKKLQADAAKVMNLIKNTE
ncbi:unnamed protein product [Zymoseptoria tritici ST99CH_1E4]|uniref:Uncharacterized protein n=1 Tax=Zymoseptoria tritici ST99CH_1E4 TaxID=1276532 RepID=A0A2H1G5D3_ZYMTR|nr:unnamed protein product [Zymoseptoria tritici ST99CH_1E4]